MKQFRHSFANSFKLIISFLLLTTCTFAQGIKNLLFHEPDTTVFTIVEKNPEFPGGTTALKNYLVTNVRYTPEAKKAGIKDRVFISFIIEPDGRMNDIRRLNEIGYGCDEEAMRVVKEMPQWAPGSQSRKLLRVKVTLPILFGIDYPKTRIR